MGGQNGVMASRKMVFLDVDGTYLAGGVVPPSASDAVRAARANGHQVLLCTGRPLVQIFDEITEAGFDGVIASAGGMVTYRGETLHSTATASRTGWRATPPCSAAPASRTPCAGSRRSRT